MTEIEQHITERAELHAALIQSIQCEHSAWDESMRRAMSKAKERPWSLTWGDVDPNAGDEP